MHILLFDGIDLLDALAFYKVFPANEEETAKFVSAEVQEMVESGVNLLQIQASCKGIVCIQGVSGFVQEKGPDMIQVKLQ
ncbi:hypothetical protein P4283_29375 [Bacillus thuringiensis]|nr:hypothetical protein [Bacillus thuringiensis]